MDPQNLSIFSWPHGYQMAELDESDFLMPLVTRPEMEWLTIFFMIPVLQF